MCKTGGSTEVQLISYHYLIMLRSFSTVVPKSFADKPFSIRLNLGR